MAEKPDAVDKLAVTGDRLTIVLEQLADGKIRVTSLAWTDAVVIRPDQVLEVRSIDRIMRVARKARDWDADDRQPTPMQVNPYDFVDDTATEPVPNPTVVHPPEPVGPTPADNAAVRTLHLAGR